MRPPPLRRAASSLAAVHSSSTIGASATSVAATLLLSLTYDLLRCGFRRISRSGLGDRGFRDGFLLGQGVVDLRLAHLARDLVRGRGRAGTMEEVPHPLRRLAAEPVDGRDLLHARLLDPLQRPELPEQCTAAPRADARDLLQHRLEVPGPAQLAVERDREPMRLVAQAR